MVGKDDGKGVGSWLGGGVGRTVGSGLGLGVGADVGIGDGTEVGTKVGKGVGAGIGVAVGSGVGTRVGSMLGLLEMLGCGVGAGVGREVGSGVGKAVVTSPGAMRMSVKVTTALESPVHDDLATKYVSAVSALSRSTALKVVGLEVKAGTTTSWVPPPSAKPKRSALEGHVEVTRTCSVHTAPATHEECLFSSRSCTELKTVPPPSTLVYCFGVR
jgi:hypothetical protein